MKHLPNILTGLRLALALFMFLALAIAGGAAATLGLRLTLETTYSLEYWAFWAFVVAAVTDFFDGWLARPASGARSSIRSPTRCWSARRCWGCCRWPPIRRS
jgi:phosphatidylglycerophosphate synthase